MADWGQIIAGIDGYRNYENNRALDLQNQAQLIQNQANDIRKNEMMTINDIKGQIAALSDNPYAKLNAWDPQARGQQLLNEDKQLKIASKWASSIKNLAPEKRAQGYAQFLRAMPGYGIDVSDMPQAYDEAYINQLADLGIETETRYQNEQQNARQERQIEAQREARQDEFNKRLAAFNYENSYKTKAEKQKLDEKDAFVRGLGYDDDTTNSLLAANRGITTPGTDDIMLKRLNNNPQDAAARAYFQNKAEAAKFIKENEPVKPLNDKEKSEMGKNLGWTADPDVYNSEGKIEFKPKPQENSNDIDERIRAYRRLNEEFPNMPEQDKQKIAFGDTYSGAAYGAGLKAGAEAEATQPYLIARDNNASANRINENITGQYVGDKIKRGQMVLENDIKKDFEAWKNEQPTEAVLDALQQAQRLNADGFRKADGSEYTASDILYTPYRKAILDNLKTTADIAQIKANTEKTQKEAETAGKTPQIQNAEYLRQNPDMADSPVFQRAGTTVNIDNKAEAKEAQDRAAQKVKAENDYRVAVAMRNEALPRIDSIIEDITENPNTVGAFSSWKEEYNKYTGKNPEWQKIRGNVVRKIKTVANDLIAKAKQSGTSGINTVAEINFIVGNVSPDASPETLIGALEALKGETESFTAKTWDYYQSFDKPLVPYAPYSTANQQNGASSEVPQGVIPYDKYDEVRSK